MNAARGSSETAWNGVSTLTPCHFMSSFVHLVTQLMSTTYVFDGSLRNSSQLQLTGCRTNPSMVKRHWSSRIRGVGPDDSTGQSSTRYWPGGIRPACSGWRRLPKNPRETNRSAKAPEPAYSVCGTCVASEKLDATGTPLRSVLSTTQYFSALRRRRSARSPRTSWETVTLVLHRIALSPIG